MSNTPDFTAMFEQMFQNMPQMPKDFSAFANSTKEAAEFNSKLNSIALEAAQKNAELSAKWTQDVLSNMGTLNTPQDQPADYAKVVKDAAEAQVQGTPERLSAFAEVAKTAQIEAVELIMNKTKEIQAQATKA